MVSCLALIGRSPTSCTRLPTYTHSPYHGPASDSHSAWRSKDADPRLFRARSLRNILHDIIHSSRKGRYCQSVRRTVQTIWRLLSSIGYFTFTVFWCSYLFTALTMAVLNQAESSSSLPPCHSPRRHDPKNTTFHIPNFDSIFCCLLQGSEQVASPVDMVIV